MTKTLLIFEKIGGLEIVFYEYSQPAHTIFMGGMMKGIALQTYSRTVIGLYLTQLSH